MGTKNDIHVMPHGKEASRVNAESLRRNSASTPSFAVFSVATRSQVDMILRPALRFLTGPFPPGYFAARFLAAVIRPPLLFFAILNRLLFLLPGVADPDFLNSNPVDDSCRAENLHLLGRFAPLDDSSERLPALRPSASPLGRTSQRSSRFRARRGLHPGSPGAGDERGTGGGDRISTCGELVGAGNGDRTRDFHLGKKMLSFGTLADACG
jgi:hypothetical protein